MKEIIEKRNMPGTTIDTWLITPGVSLPTEHIHSCGLDWKLQNITNNIYILYIDVHWCTLNLCIYVFRSCPQQTYKWSIFIFMGSNPGELPQSSAQTIPQFDLAPTAVRWWRSGDRRGSSSVLQPPTWPFWCRSDCSPLRACWGCWWLTQHGGKGRALPRSNPQLSIEAASISRSVQLPPGDCYCLAAIRTISSAHWIQYWRLRSAHDRMLNCATDTLTNKQHILRIWSCNAYYIYIHRTQYNIYTHIYIYIYIYIYPYTWSGCASLLVFVSGAGSCTARYTYQKTLKNQIDKNSKRYRHLLTWKHA